MSQLARIRVLQLGKFYHPVAGGIEEQLFNLCSDLKGALDLRVLVSNTRARTVTETVEDVQVVRAARLGEFMATPLCPTLHTWIRRMPADVIHLHLPNPMAHLALLASRPRARLVATWHSDVVKRGMLPKIYGLLVTRLLRDCDVIIATSPRYIEFSEFLRRQRDRCLVIPNGVPPERYVLRPADAQRVEVLQRRHGSRMVLFVGRIVSYKGLGYLLEAMRDVDGKLVIIGRGRDEADLRRTAKRAGLDGKVEFAGGVTREELVAYFHACRVLALPSIEPSEAFGVVQLEAMACSKPVVSTELPTGVPWVNQDGRTGFVVPPRDAASLATAISRVLDDPVLGAELGSNGRHRVWTEFNSHLLSERILRVFVNNCAVPFADARRDCPVV